MKFIFYDWGGLNIWLFHLINEQHGPVLDKFMLLGTELGDHHNFLVYFFIATAYALVACTLSKNPRTVAIEWALTISVFIAGYFLVEEIVAGLKIWLDYPRPSIALNGALHIIGTPDIKYSTPSGHAAFTMLLVMSFWYVANRPLRIIFMVLLIWVGVSRVSLGAHFPADVLVGYLLSGIAVYALHKLLKYALQISQRTH